MADGLLLTRKERLRFFTTRLGAGLGPTLVLVAVAAALGGGAVAFSIAVVGVLCGLLVATSAKTIRGALVAGVAIAAVLFVLQIVFAWFVTHPIE